MASYTRPTVARAAPMSVGTIGTGMPMQSYSTVQAPRVYAGSAATSQAYGTSSVRTLPATTFQSQPVQSFQSQPVQFAQPGFAGARVISAAPTVISGAPTVMAAPVQTFQTVVSAAPVAPVQETMTLSYWPLFAKGVATAIALEISGLPWQLGPAPGSKGTGDLWGEWLEMKPDTTWGFLPNLEIGGGEKVGSELAILQYLARVVGPSLSGANDVEFRISQELLHQSEELYQKLTTKCPSIMAPDKSVEDFEMLWTGADRQAHSNSQGMPVYLTQFEEYYAKVGGAEGKFTSSGITIGEIKLYSTLALLLLIDNGVLENYPGVLQFYLRWDQDKQVKDMLDKAMSEWGWQQYFIAPPAPVQGEQ